MDRRAVKTVGDLETAIARCSNGEQAGYDSLYDQFAPGIYSLCYSLLLNPEHAEDVTQESFVYAFKNLHRFDAQRSSFKTWLYTIAMLHLLLVNLNCCNQSIGNLPRLMLL